MRSVGQGFPRTGLRGAWGPQGHTAHCGAPGPALCRQGGRDGTCRDGARLWLPALSAHHRAEGAWRAGPRPSVVAPGSGGLPCAACWSGAAVGPRPGSWGDRKPRADCHSAGQALRTRALRRSDSPGVELASAHCLAPRAEWGWLGSQAPSSWKPLEAQHSSAPCYCTALSPSATQNPWPLSCRGHSRGRVLMRGVPASLLFPPPPSPALCPAGTAHSGTETAQPNPGTLGSGRVVAARDKWSPGRAGGWGERSHLPPQLGSPHALPPPALAPPDLSQRRVLLQPGLGVKGQRASLLGGYMASSLSESHVGGPLGPAITPSGQSPPPSPRSWPCASPGGSRPFRPPSPSPKAQSGLEGGSVGGRVTSPRASETPKGQGAGTTPLCSPPPRPHAACPVPCPGAGDDWPLSSCP